MMISSFTSSLAPLSPGTKARTRTSKRTKGQPQSQQKVTSSELRVDTVARRFKKNVGTPGNLWKSLENRGWDSNDIANIG